MAFIEQKNNPHIFGNTLTTLSALSAQGNVKFDNDLSAKNLFISGASTLYGSLSTNSAIKAVSFNAIGGGLVSDLSGNSGQWNNVYSQVNNLSAGWGTGGGGTGYYCLVGSCNLIPLCGSNTNNSSNYGNIGGGSSNLINGSYAFIGGGLSNQVHANCSGILAGTNNNICGNNTFAIGSNICSNISGFTIVNNLSSIGKLYGDGSLLTNVIAGGFSYSNNCSLSSINSVYGNNTASGCSSLVSTGNNNTVSGNCSVILGGCGNNISGSSSFALGSNLCSGINNYTFVNNISSTGRIYGDCITANVGINGGAISGSSFTTSGTVCGGTVCSTGTLCGNNICGSSFTTSGTVCGGTVCSTGTLCGNNICGSSFTTSGTICGSTICSTGTLCGNKLYGDGSGLINVIACALSVPISSAYTTNGSTSAIFSCYGTNTASGNSSLVLNGNINIASGAYSTIVNGASSYATGYMSFIGSGSGNCVTSKYSTIVNGLSNLNSGENAFIGAGRCNIIVNNACNSFIGAGQNNCINSPAFGVFIGAGFNNCQSGAGSGVYGFIGSGYCNSIQSGAIVAGSRNIAGYGFIGSGVNNTACDGFIGNGAYNCIDNCNSYSSIVNGYCNNIICNSLSFIGGGCSNTASNYFSTIVNAASSLNYAKLSFVGAGSANRIYRTSCYGVILGGVCNTITNTGYNAKIGNGCCNTICDCYSSILNGSCNKIDIGGYYSNIAGGFQNYICGNYSGILGGQGNQICGNCTYAIGNNIVTKVSNYTIVNNLSTTGNLTVGTSLYTPNLSAGTFSIGGTLSIGSLSASGSITAGTSLYTPNLSANNVYSTGNQTVLSDGYGSNDQGNGPNTISLNYANGAYIGLSGSGSLYALGVPQYYEINSNYSTAIGVNSLSSFFVTANTYDYLLANARYEIEYQLYNYKSSSTGNITYAISANGNFTQATITYLHGNPYTGGALSNGYFTASDSYNSYILPIGSGSTAIVGPVSSYDVLKTYIKTGSTPVTLGIYVSAGGSAGIYPLRGSYRKVTRVY